MTLNFHRKSKWTKYLGNWANNGLVFLCPHLVWHAVGNGETVTIASNKRDFREMSRAHIICRNIRCVLLADT